MSPTFTEVKAWKWLKTANSAGTREFHCSRSWCPFIVEDPLNQPSWISGLKWYLKAILHFVVEGFLWVFVQLLYLDKSVMVILILFQTLQTTARGSEQIKLLHWKIQKRVRGSLDVSFLSGDLSLLPSEKWTAEEFCLTISSNVFYVLKQLFCPCFTEEEGPSGV